jgi:hypothetical protein
MRRFIPIVAVAFASPVSAQRAAIGGVVLRSASSLPTRLVPRSMVHVGLSAQGYPAKHREYPLDLAPGASLITVAVGKRRGDS